MDDVRLGAAVRVWRGRRGWRQADLAARAHVTRRDVSLLETGRAREVRLGRIAAIFGALGGWLVVEPRMVGGDLVRTLNSRHAAMHEVAARLFATAGGWALAHEVSFSIYGERGVIDILAWHAATRTLLIVELKTSIVDANEIVGSMDRRRRLASRIARERGWDPLVVAAWVLVADTRTNRRRLAEHALLLRGAFPVDGRAMRSWLRKPGGSIASLSFLPAAPNVHSKQVAPAPRRVRRPGPRSAVRAERVSRTSKHA
jgi:transcriptional regulator with XRE-family HTH domain